MCPIRLKQSLVLAKVALTLVGQTYSYSHDSVTVIQSLRHSFAAGKTASSCVVAHSHTAILPDTDRFGKQIALNQLIFGISYSDWKFVQSQVIRPRLVCLRLVPGNQ